MFRKVRDVVRAQGVADLAGRTIAFAYRQGIRPCIPFGKAIHYAGIPICHDRKWGDRLVPITWVPYEARADYPDYEAGLVAGLREIVRPGDNVVIVGAGLGVTAVVAALRAGPFGIVQCFEGNKQRARSAKQTAARNKIPNIRIHHAVVAKTLNVYEGDIGIVLPVSQLPACDVLELDCEGSEVEILRELTIQPRMILVETHGIYDAPTDLVASLLEKRGYTVSHRGLAEHSDLCAKHDIRVLLGRVGD
jgi:hypothetical protein